MKSDQETPSVNHARNGLGEEKKRDVPDTILTCFSTLQQKLSTELFHSMTCFFEQHRTWDSINSNSVSFARSQFYWNTSLNKIQDSGQRNIERPLIFRSCCS